ncbi:MAG: phosphohydrolase, partial [Firmicutes bacterium]|nr:phosphohydrolase [Bacillota bacterium]
GKYQEKVSDPLVREMLGGLGFDPEIIERAAFVVSHHHTYKDIDGPDYQILVEADFLVNLYEEDEEEEAIVAARDSIFKTETGKKLLDEMFLADRQTFVKEVRT